MKKSTVFTIILSFIVLLSFSCAGPGGPEISADIIDIADVSFSGEAISTEEEAIQTSTIVLGTALSSMGYAVSNDSDVVNTFNPEAPAEGKTRAASFTFNFDMDTFKGDAAFVDSGVIAYPNDETQTFSYDINAAASVDHSLTFAWTTPEPAQLELVPTDDPCYVDIDAAITAEMEFDNITAYDNYDGGKLTIEKGFFSVDFGFTTDLTNLTFADNSAAILPTPYVLASGTLAYTMDVTFNYVLAVSSTHPDYKGGKIVLTASASKALSNFNLYTFQGSIETFIQNSSESMDPDEFKGLLEDVIGQISDLSIDVKVFNQENQPVYEKLITGENVFSLASAAE